MAPLAEPRDYRVEDSIEMTTVVDPPPLGVAKALGDRALAVVKHGDLARGVDVYTLLVIGMRAPADGASPVRTVLSLDSASNEGAIGQPRWGDRAHVFFKSREPSGRNAIRRVNVDTGAEERWAEHPTEILHFAVAGDVVFFAARAPLAEARAAQPAIRVAEEHVANLMAARQTPPTGIDYFVRKAGGRVARVLSQPGPLYPIATRVWISPSGSRGVLLRRPERIPASWAGIGRGGELQRLAATDDPTRVSIQTLQFVLVDFASGTAEPLVDAPTGWSVGVHHEFDVVWIDDDRVVVSNTLMPLPRSADVPNHASIAEVDLSARRVAQVAELEITRLGSEGGGGIVGLRWHSRLQRLEARRVGPEGPMRSQWFERRADGIWRVAAEAPANDFPRVTVMQSLDSPHELALQEDVAAARRRITSFNSGLLGSLAPVEVLRWTDSAGRRWKGGLIMPRGAPCGIRPPLVIQTHGFDERGFLADGSGALMDGARTSVFAARALAARGMAVLQVDDHGEVGGTAEGAGYLDGYRSAVELLSRVRGIDAGRVGLVGHSRMAYHVKHALAFDDGFAAGVIADGVDMSYMQYLMSANTRARADIHSLYERANGGKPFGEGLAAWQRTAPGFNVHRVRAAVRIEAYGSRSLLHEWEFFAGLKSLNRPVELFYYPDGAHTLAKPLERLASQTGTVDWMAFWLACGEDRHPAKAEQYERWRKLRALKVRSPPEY